jgi:uncharacterized protein YndB with AHSA1/START domain
MTALELERVVPARAEVAFQAFAEPGQLAQWWGPHGFSVPDLDWKPRAGAGFRITMQPAEGEAFYLRGEFVEVAVPEKLSFTFTWEPPNPDDVETLVELTLTDLGDATRVHLHQGEFKTEERLELHRGGWTDSFDRLEQLTRRPPPASPR